MKRVFVVVFAAVAALAWQALGPSPSSAVEDDGRISNGVDELGVVDVAAPPLGEAELQDLANMAA